jgi:hypothetical protein
VPCVGGNGAIERLAFPESCGSARSIDDIGKAALRLLTDRAYYQENIARIETVASPRLSFQAGASQLEDFFS